jgi:hypothetical protein
LVVVDPGAVGSAGGAPAGAGVVVVLVVPGRGDRPCEPEAAIADFLPFFFFFFFLLLEGWYLAEQPVKLSGL